MGQFTPVLYSLHLCLSSSKVEVLVFSPTYFLLEAKIEKILLVNEDIPFILNQKGLKRTIEGSFKITSMSLLKSQTICSVLVVFI